MYGIHQVNNGNQVYFHGERVMVVDDSELNLEMLNLVLRDFGLAPDIFQNGSLALSHFFMENEFYYQYILIDLNMHGVNGYELIRQIRTSTRKDGKSIPIFVMTADITETNHKAFEEYNINGHIDKPVNFHILLQEFKGELEWEKKR